MTYEHFLQVILHYKKFSEDISSLYDIGFDLMEGKYTLTYPVEKILEASIKSYYGEQGWDWVNWFIYESEYGQRDWSASNPIKVLHTDESVSEREISPYGAQDEDGNPICYSYESLWQYLEKIRIDN
jgi:hypothetical protein